MNLLTIKLGPLVLPLNYIMMIVAVLVSYGVAYLIGRRQKTVKLGNLLSDMLITGLLAARLVFVVIWFELYLAAPWSLHAVGDHHRDRAHARALVLVDRHRPLR